MSEFKCQHQACDNWTFGNLCMYPSEAKVNCEKRSRRMNTGQVGTKYAYDNLEAYKEGYQQGREDTLNDEFRVRDAYQKGWDDAIDELTKRVCTLYTDYERKCIYMDDTVCIKQNICDIAEQIKGEKNESDTNC